MSAEGISQRIPEVLKQLDLHGFLLSVMSGNTGGGARHFKTEI